VIVNWASRWMQRTPPVFRSICVIHISINATKMPAVFILVQEAITVNAAWVLVGMDITVNPFVMFPATMEGSASRHLCVVVLLVIQEQIVKKTLTNACLGKMFINALETLYV